MNTTALQKYDGVQVLRFVAAAMVVILHSMFYAHERLDSSFPVWSGGSAGVDIFFVISGFVMVVASRRLDGEWMPWGLFLTRRAFRILPMYWLVTTVSLAVLIAAPALVLHSELDVWSIVNSYLLIPDVNSDRKIEPLVGVGWTLYFESLFYVLFGLALMLRASPLVVVPPILVVLAVLGAFKTPEWPPVTTYLDPIVLEFAMGMGIAVWMRLFRAPWWGVAILATGIIALLLPSELPRALAQGVPAALIVGGVVLMEPLLSRFNLKYLVFLGETSYVLYLFHTLVAPVWPVGLAKLGTENAPLSVVLSFSSSVVFSALCYKLADAPSQKFLAGVVRSIFQPSPDLWRQGKRLAATLTSTVRCFRYHSSRVAKSACTTSHGVAGGSESSR